MALNISAALTCASLIFGMPNAHPERDLVILASPKVLDQLCRESGNSETRSAGGCNAAFVIDGEHEIIVARSGQIDWETQVAESCHILQHRNGLPQSEAQCRHAPDWRRYYAERIKACTAKGIRP